VVSGHRGVLNSRSHLLIGYHFERLATVSGVLALRLSCIIDVLVLSGQESQDERQPLLCSSRCS
jgi:hypothetical protein